MHAGCVCPLAPRAQAPLPLEASGVGSGGSASRKRAWLVLTSFLQARRSAASASTPLSGPQPAPGGYFHLAGKAGSCGPCWPGGTPAGTYTRVFLVQSWDAAKEVVSAFGEPTALPLRVRGVGKGEARVGKTDLYPCRTRSTPFFKMLTFMPVRSKTFSLTEYFKP